MCKFNQLYKNLPVGFSINTAYVAIDILYMLYTTMIAKIFT